MCKPADTNKLISFSVPIFPLGIKARVFCTVSTQHYSQLHTQTLFFLFFPSFPYDYWNVQTTSVCRELWFPGGNPGSKCTGNFSRIREP